MYGRLHTVDFSTPAHDKITRCTSLLCRQQTWISLPRKVHVQDVLARGAETYRVFCQQQRTRSGNFILVTLQLQGGTARLHGNHATKPPKNSDFNIISPTW